MNHIRKVVTEISRKKNMQKFEKFLQKVKQGFYYICITYL